MAEQGRDEDWSPRDPARLDDVRRGLEDLDQANDVQQLSEAIAAALRATAGSRFDQDKLWERVERSLEAGDESAPGPEAASGQSDEDSTPGR